MVAILEKSEHNVDFHPIVDFVEASPLRYALTFKPTVYVSHIRQFWSTARIETTEEGTKILATVDGILRTVTESLLRRNFKLQDEDGISSLPDTELFENLTLMGYNISPNQKFTFQKGFNEFSSNIATALVCLATNKTYIFSKMIFDGLVKNVNSKGEGSGTPTEPHHTPSPEAQPSSHTTHSSPTIPSVTTALIPLVTSFDTPPIRQYTKRTRIAQSSVLPPVADEPASPLRYVSQGEACLTDSGFIADQDRATIAKSSTLPHDSAPKMIAKFEAREVEINRLKAIVKLLEDRDEVAAKRSGDDAPIKGRNLDEGKATAERVSDDTEEMSTVLTSMDAATVLESKVARVPTGSGSISTASPPVAEVSTGSDVVPTASLVFATATVVTLYRRRKGKEVMVESETLKKQKVQEQIDAQVARELEEQLEREDQRMSEQIARDAEVAKIHVEEELQSMIDGLDRSNETVAKYLQEYQQFASELPLERRIELISDLVRYQDNYAKVHKFQTQQRKPWSKKQKRDYYMAVIRSNLGWKVKDFRGMSFEEIKVKFTTVWKQLEDFIPMGSKEEAERLKRKGLSLEQESAKKLKSSDEVPEEEKVHTEGKRSCWKITRLGGSSASYQFFIDMLKHLDREDLNQLWRIVKESLSNRQPTSDKEMELWVELKRLYEPDDEDQLVDSHLEPDACFNYPLRKGLAIVMISYKLQVENYSRMENDLILKIFKIASTPRQQVIEFSLAEEVPTASEESSHCQKKRNATAKRIVLL
nr:hypothetical protein [Tanacetum cinerariifolium]